MRKHGEDESTRPTQPPGQAPGEGETPSEESPAPAEAAARPGGSEVSEDLKRKAAERDLYLNELLRAKADLDNYLKRVRKDRPVWEEQAVDRLIRRLLPVVDNLERALDSAKAPGASLGSLEKGVRLTRDMMRDVFHEYGVKEIPALGEAFRPDVHEAFAVEASDRPAGEITEVLEKGYQRKEIVIRPSRVKVAQQRSGSAQADSSDLGGEDERQEGQ